MNDIKNKKNEIVFIDDKKKSLESLLDYLETHTNLKISVFEDANVGIKYIENTPHIVAVLIDLNMPQVNGQYIAEKIKDLGLKIPLIILTVIEPEKDFLKRCYEKGIVDYIMKPQGISEHFIVVQKIKIFEDLYIAKRDLEEEKKFREQAMTKFERFNSTYMHLIDRTKTAMFVVNSSDKIIEKNELFDDILGESDEVFKNNIDAEYQPKYEETIKNILKEEETYECNLKLNNGSWINISGVNIYNSTIAFIAKDVSKKFDLIAEQQKSLQQKVQSIRDYLNEDILVTKKV